MKNIIYLYKKFFLISYLLFTILHLASAQPNRDQYRDQKWLFGYESENHAQYSIAGNSILDFTTEPPTAEYQYMPMDFETVSTNFCDTAGNLVMYSNSIYIADKMHQKMVNGDSLDYGQYWQAYRDFGSSAIQGGVCILPIPNKKNSAIQLYHDFESPNGRYIVKGLKAAFIDLDRNNGNGVVIQKDVQVFLDSMQGVLATACRHANGRDWWLIGIKWGMGKYYKTLVTPSGLVPQTPQIMPYLSGSQETSKVAYFSPDGTKYAHYNSGEGTWLYDFDRCKGMLSNRRLIPLFRAFRTPYCGIAFSPNSRYLYVTDDSQIVQYDLEASNISTSGVVVAEYDGFTDPIMGDPLGFFLLQLAPNNKIYANVLGDTRYLHVIHNPDERGLACNVAQHDFMLPTYYRGGTMPNFPYFRLGSEPGTVCDSLGIETGVTNTLATNPLNPPKGDFQLSVSPNPTSGECTVSLLSSPFGGQRGFVRLLSADGRLLETFSNPFLSQSSFTINLKNYAKGVYIVEYATDSGSSARARVVRY